MTLGTFTIDTDDTSQIDQLQLWIGTPKWGQIIRWVDCNTISYTKDLTGAGSWSATCSAREVFDFPWEYTSDWFDFPTRFQKSTGTTNKPMQAFITFRSSRTGLTTVMFSGWLLNVSEDHNGAVVMSGQGSEWITHQVPTFRDLGEPEGAVSFDTGQLEIFSDVYAGVTGPLNYPAVTFSGGPVRQLSWTRRKTLTFGQILDSLRDLDDGVYFEFRGEIAPAGDQILVEPVILDWQGTLREGTTFRSDVNVSKWTVRHELSSFSSDIVAEAGSLSVNQSLTELYPELLVSRARNFSYAADAAQLAEMADNHLTLTNGSILTCQVEVDVDHLSAQGDYFTSSHSDRVIAEVGEHYPVHLSSDGRVALAQNMRAVQVVVKQELGRTSASYRMVSSAAWGVAI